MLSQFSTVIAPNMYKAIQGSCDTDKSIGIISGSHAAPTFRPRFDAQRVRSQIRQPAGASREMLFQIALGRSTWAEFQLSNRFLVAMIEDDAGPLVDCRAMISVRGPPPGFGAPLRYGKSSHLYI